MKESMHFCRTGILAGAALLSLVVTACGTPGTPTADTVGTSVVETAFALLTQTAAAASPTPLPPTSTPEPTATEVPSPSPTSSQPPQMPRTVNFAACWLGGPGNPYALDSNIKAGKAVEFFGQGNSPGWFVIRNPYFHRPCWILASDLKLFEGTDPSTYPVMTPGIPRMGQ